MPTITDPRIAHDETLDDILDAPTSNDWVWVDNGTRYFEILYPQRGPVLLSCGCFEGECICEDQLRDTVNAIACLTADTGVILANNHAAVHGGILTPAGHCADCDQLR